MTKATSALSNTQIKDYTKRVLAVNNEIREAKDSLKELFLEAKGNGIDVKALKAAVRIIENTPEPELRETINFYLETTGQLRFFA